MPLLLLLLLILWSFLLLCSTVDATSFSFSTLPTQDTISILHNAVTAGVVPVVQELLTSERFALSRDQYGATPLHKAVLFYQPKIVKIIAEKYRITTRAKDQEGRTPLHYAAALHDSGIFYRYLLKCGADEHIQDKASIFRLFSFIYRLCLAYTYRTSSL